MGSQTAAGSSLAISVTSPATADATGYADLTFTDVGQVEKLGSIGASFAKVAPLECDIVLTPHPSASNMSARFAGKAALFDPAGCKNYAAAKAKGLDERLAKEAAAK